MVKMKFFGVRNYLFILFVAFACANVNGQTADTIAEPIQEEVEFQEEYYLEEDDSEVSNIYLNLVSFNLTNQIPLETFSRNLDGTRFGLSFSYYNNFRKKDDLFWGVHISNFRIDRLSNTFIVQEQFVEFDLFSRTKTSLVFLGYGVRYYPDIYTALFEPFIDVKLGSNFVYTFTSDRIDGAEEADITFNETDLTFAYAVGLGVQYNVRQGQAIQLTVDYNSGGSASYYVVDDKGFQNPLDNFVRRTTQLDYVQIALGLTFGF